jgi:toluene-4-monooxygenase system protein B
MAPFPIVGRFVGDFFPHLVAVDTDDTMDVVAAKVALHSVGTRITAPARASAYDVFVDDRRIEPSTTLGELNLLPLQWVDVKFRA